MQAPDPLLTADDFPESPDEIISRLAPVLTSERCARIAQVVAGRTYDVVPVLETLYDRGNVSAVLRSAEGLGFQSVHLVDNSPHFKEARRVTQGAEKWLEITSWPDTPGCYEALRAQGYRIAVTHFEDAIPLRELDVRTPVALVFGNERDGVSPYALAQADTRVVIPMDGFAQSFNISVAAALCLYDIRERRLRTLGYHGNLSAERAAWLTATYYLRSAPNAPQILARARAQA